MDIKTLQKNSMERPNFFPCQWCKGMFTARALQLHIGSCFKVPTKSNNVTINIKKKKLIITKKKQYKCTFCLKVFNQIHRLKCHLLSKCCHHLRKRKPISSKIRFRVPLSNKKMEYKKEISVIISHGKNVNKSLKRQLVTSVENATENALNKKFQHIPCKICHLVFAHEESFQEHLKSHTLHDKGIELDIPMQNHDILLENTNDFTKENNSKTGSDLSTENMDVSLEPECSNTNSESVVNTNSTRTSVIVNSELLLICHKCNLTFVAEEDYNKHCLTHEVKATCSVCGECVPQETYGQHIIQHAVVDNGQYLRCAHCEKDFLNETLLLVHYRVHINEDQFFCTECHQRFNQAIDLKHHTLSVHEHLQLQPYHCYICFHRFSQPHAIINHMRLHTGEMPFKCQECGRAFTQLGNLQRHLNMHRGERPHKCQVCEKGFADPATLRNHIRIHTGEMPYVCNVCKRAFSQIGNLKRHMSKHLALKPHCCPDCGKSFAHESTLRNHRRIHTGEQPFKCTICSRAFSQIGNLKRHMAKHALQQDFQCGQCSKTFDSPQDLVQHECTCIENAQVSASEEETTPELPVPCHMITQWPKCTSQSQKLLRKLAMEARQNVKESQSLNNKLDIVSKKNDAWRKDSNSKEEESSNTISSNKDGAVSRKWRIFPCPVCGKVYTWQYDLKIHYRIHSGEKPYRCEQCGKGFAQSGAVRTHKARHHQDETEQPASPDSSNSSQEAEPVEPNALFL